MNPFINIIIAVYVITFCLILAFFWKDILMKLKPSWFYRFLIFSENGNIEENVYLIRWTNRNDFKFKDGIYRINPKTVHKKNNINTWFFVEGNPDSLMISLDYGKSIAQTLDKFLEIKINDLWTDFNGITDFLQKYGILIVIIVMLIGFYIIGNQKSTVEVVLNTSMLRG